jgi:intergrase/recombinase
MKKFSKIYINLMRAYFKKHLSGKTFSSPLELEKYIQTQTKGTCHIIKAARNYLNYCEKMETLSEAIIQKYRKFLKITTSQPDVYVPSNEEVIETYQTLHNNSDLELVFLVLVTSGIRLVECLDFLQNYDPNKLKISQNHVSYAVSQLRHTKNINNIYLPLFVYSKLKQVSLAYDALRVQYNRTEAKISLKYLRKWHYNFMLYNGVPESVADFIQGRAGKGVSANHYLARSQQADYWYDKIANGFEKLFGSLKQVS